MKKELIGYCGVDSGQLMITDPSYAITNNKIYQKICNETIKKRIGNIIIKNKAGNCIAIQTNTGDGLYPIYIERHKDGKQIRKIIIKLDCWE